MAVKKKRKKAEQTSKKVAQLAGTQLRDPKSTKAEKSVAGSALTQAPDKKAKKQKTAEQTSKSAASLAGKQLRSKSSTKAEKTVAGSTLTQAPPKKKTRGPYPGPRRR